jgi:hypothetical protein
MWLIVQRSLLNILTLAFLLLPNVLQLKVVGLGLVSRLASHFVLTVVAKKLVVDCSGKQNDL